MSTPAAGANRVPLLGALTGLLFAAGVLGLAVVDDGGDGGDEVGMTSTTAAADDTSTTSTTVVLTTTTTMAVTTTSPVGGVGVGGAGTGATTTTLGSGSGLGAGGSGIVPGSDEMAETGAELLLFPGLAALGAALGARRLRG